MLSNNISHKTIQIINRGELKNQAPTMPQEYWQKRILAQGYRVLIAGAPKVGKSDFFLEMGLRAASGGAFLGKYFSRPLRVLYLQSEIHEAYLNERISLFEKNHCASSMDLINQNFYVSRRLTLDLMKDKDWSMLQEMLVNIKPDIVGIDPIISFSSVDENSSKEVSNLLYNRIVHLQDSVQSNPAIVLIHHLKKIRDENELSLFSSIRGSGAWQGWYDTGILLSKRDNTIVANYDTRHQRPPPTQHMILNREMGCWQVAKKATKDFDEKVEWGLHLLRETHDPFTVSELRTQLIETLGIARRTAYKVIASLKENSDVQFQDLDKQTTLIRFKEKSEESC